MKEKIDRNFSLVSERNRIPFIGDYREFVCGWGAAAVNITVTFPVNKLIFRQVITFFRFFHLIWS